VFPTAQVFLASIAIKGSCELTGKDEISGVHGYT